MNLSPVIQTFGNEDQSWLASAHGTPNARSITIDVTKLTLATHYPHGYLRSGAPLSKLIATGLFAPYVGDVSEVQTVTITGAPTGGTFTLTFGGDTTAPIAFNATAAAVQAALVALASIGAGNVVVTGAAGGVWTVTFQGELSGEDVVALTESGTGLTGGTSPAVGVATTTPGGTDTTTDGTQTLVGFLFTTLEIVNRDGSIPTEVSGALLDHCSVVEAKLPFPVDEGGKADVVGSIIFV